jgi:hypothetical protein
VRIRVAPVRILSGPGARVFHIRGPGALADPAGWGQHRGMDLPALILSGDRARVGRDTRDLARQAAAGEFQRIRQGVYVRADEWALLQPWERYPLLTHAAASTLRSRTVFCHQSSAALWDMPLLGGGHTVHACTSDDGGGRSRAGVRRHFVDLESTPVEERRDCP